MGNSIYKRWFAQKPVKVLISGLDAAGKTTMLYKLKLGEIVTTIPTIGFNVETVKTDSVQLTMWDVGSRDKMRPLMRFYYPDTDGLIWVVDSNDHERMDEVKDELQKMAVEDELRNVPILVYANKQDLVNSVSVPVLAEKLELKKLSKSNHRWHVVGSSATEGTGLVEGLDWLTQQLVNKETKHVINKATEKSATLGWSYAVCGLDRVKAWIWGDMWKTSQPITN